MTRHNKKKIFPQKKNTDNFLGQKSVTNCGPAGGTSPPDTVSEAKTIPEDKNARPMCRQYCLQYWKNFPVVLTET